MLPEELRKIFDHVEANQAGFIRRLRDAVRIPSVSAAPEKRDDVIAMISWTDNLLQKLGATVELANIGVQTLSDGRSLRLPPVILASLGNDPGKANVVIYGHLDVQPASLSDGWDMEPFELTEVNGKLYGRGSTDDKGPVMAWLNALETYKALNIPLPVNLKFVFEGMEESGSDGLAELLEERKGTFFKGIDYVCISDNYWLGTTKPCLTYGLRGVCSFFIEIECAARDLHSGLYGGCLNEAMSDLVYMLNSLVDRKGKILIPHIMDEVVPVTDEEKHLYSRIDFNVSDFKSEIGCNTLLHQEEKMQILMSRWRYPSLSIHGIEGAFSGEGSKTVIPKKVIGKFSIRIVPNMSPVKVEKDVVRYLNDLWQKRGSTNCYKAYMDHGGRAWLSDVNSTNFKAARNATKHVYDIEPDMTREGGSIPITLNLEEVTGADVLLIPLGRSDDAAHSQNEKIDVSNYIQGTKLLASYLYELGTLHKTSRG